MTLTFDNFETHIRFQILNKVTFPDYVNFTKCSRSSLNLTKFPVSRKILEIENMEEKDGEIFFWLRFGQEKIHLSNIFETTPVRLSVTFIDIHFTDEICEKWIKLFEAKDLIARSLTIRHEGSIDCSPENFEKFIKVSKMRRFVGEVEPDSEYFDLPAFLELEDVLLHSRYNQIPTSKVLTLKAHTIFIGSCIPTTSDVNQLLKEWLKGTRQINFIGLENGWPMEEDASFLEGLPYRTIWTKDFGANDVVRPDQVEKLEATRFYALEFRDEKIFIAIRDDNFYAHKLNGLDPEQEFRNWVDELDSPLCGN